MMARRESALLVHECDEVLQSIAHGSAHDDSVLLRCGRLVAHLLRCRQHPEDVSRAELLLVALVKHGEVALSGMVCV